jgi:hypothetical protein
MKMFKVFYRLRQGGKLYWERYRASSAEQAAVNFVALAREIGEHPIIVRVEAVQ